MRGRFEDEDEELEEDEDLEEEEEEKEEEEMSHFSLRLEGGRPDSEDEEERLINLSDAEGSGAGGVQTAKASRKQSSLSGKESAQGCVPQRLLPCIVRKDPRVPHTARRGA